MNEQIPANKALKADLRRALDRDEIKPYFQPIIRLQDGQIVGFEALARWHHPTRGVLEAESFIAAAETLGMVDLLTARILRLSCQAARDWPDDSTLSINISPVQFHDPWLVSRILAIAAECDFAPHRLIVDVTEEAVIGNFALARDVIAAFREAGVGIALDDFQMNYASLCNLQQLQFDHLKIDNKAVISMETGDDEQMVRATSGFGRALGMVVTAEGVEATASMASLRDCGCQQAQGYLLGRPLAAHETAAMIKASRA